MLSSLVISHPESRRSPCPDLIGKIPALPEGSRLHPYLDLAYVTGFLPVLCGRHIRHRDEKTVQNKQLYLTLESTLNTYEKHWGRGDRCTIARGFRWRGA